MKNRLSDQVRNKSRGQKRPVNGNERLDPHLLDLVRLRVAQIHQCPVSIAMHSEELSAKGETKERLDQLETWGTSSAFDGKERAALALCEKITLDPAPVLPEYLIRETRHYFTKAAIVNLTIAIIAVNDWNLLRCP